MNENKEAFNYTYSSAQQSEVKKIKEKYNTNRKGRGQDGTTAPFG